MSVQAADALMGIFGFKRVTKKKSKTKVTRLPTLIDKADKLASQYIRQKHADHAGNITCISCPTVLPWKEAHCAHFIERGKKATRWLEKNLHPACLSCNVYRKEWHMREYTIAMIDLYGRDEVDAMRLSAKEVLSASKVRQLAEEAIAYYSEALRGLANG